MPDTEIKDTKTPDATPETTPETSTATDLDTLKGQVANSYIDSMDTAKGPLFALGVEFNISTPMRDHAVDYLLSKEKKEEKKGFFKGLMDRLKEKIFKGAGEQKNLLSYDQKSLNIMKTKITQADKAELENLLLMIQRGEDPVKEDTTSTPLDDATKVDNANIATAAPTLAKIDAMIDGCKYTFPLVGMATLTSGFGPRIHPITGKNDMHTGIDLATNEGDKIESMTDGEVVENRKTALGGREIHIKGPDGRIYCYLHMKEQASLQKGTKVAVGQEIGLVGTTGSSTGPHLHLTIKENNVPVDPVAILPEVFDQDRISNTTG